ncbi:MAG TPA: SRPBCC family protein [Mycobacterium sp.]|nr:SRPBCC family protein [Mycobacterium sp.]
MADKATQTINIEADPDTVMRIIADIGSYPDWVSEYTEAEVLETHPDGYPKVARMVLDATVLKDTLVFSYEWAADRRSVSWSLVSSSLLKALDGEYRLAPKGSGTDVTYNLSVELGIPMIGLLKRKAERRLTDTALKDLKKRAEAE